MTLQITKITVEQVETVVPLFDEYRHFYGQNSDPERVEQFLSQRLTREESVIFIAEMKGVPCGFTQLYPSFSSVSMKPTWILNDLFVRVDARRTGIGQSLLQTAREFARERGACRLELATGIDNVMAQSLYEQDGWVKDELYFRYNYAIE